MVRKLLTADWHLTSNPRDEYRHEWQAELRQIVKEYQVDTVLLLGDICEEKDFHPATLLNRVVSNLDLLRDCCFIEILLGNHDYSQMGSPYWNFLNCIPHISFHSEVERQPQNEILYLPHTRNWEKDWKDIDFSKYKLIFAHNTFEGSDVGHGHFMKGIPTDIFGKAKVFAGDVHVPQTIGPVTYIGSPYTINFGDSFQPRVILLEGDRVTSIPCQGPQKMVIESDYSDGGLEFTRNDPELLIPGDIVQVRVFLHREDYPKWQEIVDEVYIWGKEKGVKVFQVRPEVVDGKVSSEKKRQVTSARSDKEVFESYVERMSIDEDTVKVGEKFL